jgi:hypothetical protein
MMIIAGFVEILALSLHSLPIQGGLEWLLHPFGRGRGRLHPYDTLDTLLRRVQAQCLSAF